MTFRRRLHQHRGFTLVELLVVIGIISVLVALLLPALSKARNSAQTIVCLSHMHNVGSAVFAYTAANDGCYPYLNPTGAAWPRTPFVDVPNLLYPLAPDQKSFLCPVDFDPAWNIWWTQTNGPSTGLSLSSLPFPSSYYLVYSFYTRLQSFDGVHDSAMYYRQCTPRQVKYPTRKIMMTCFARGIMGGPHAPDGLNLLFADGHAGLVRVGDLNPTDSYYPYNYDWTINGLDGADLK